MHIEEEQRARPAGLRQQPAGRENFRSDFRADINIGTGRKG
ncbi:hypothetical protein [Sphingomonas changnyeongensis]|nr:hypothetical protein [Sphingomonas changnyeongensis]